MINILLSVFEVVLFLVLFIIIVLFILWTIGNIKNKVPFVTSPKKVLEKIREELDLKDENVLYDLGSGDGRVIFYLAEKNPKVKYIGIENNPFPVIISKIDKFLKRKKISNSVDILNKDFFKVDLSNATHVFTYLYPNVMDDLLTKFDEELKPGTKLVSLSFQFTNKRPVKEIDLGRNKYSLGRKIYVYQF